MADDNEENPGLNFTFEEPVVSHSDFLNQFGTPTEQDAKPPQPPPAPPPPPPEPETKTKAAGDDGESPISDDELELFAELGIDLTDFGISTMCRKISGIADPTIFEADKKRLVKMRMYATKIARMYSNEKLHPGWMLAMLAGITWAPPITNAVIIRNAAKAKKTKAPFETTDPGTLNEIKEMMNQPRSGGRPPKEEQALREAWEEYQKSKFKKK